MVEKCQGHFLFQDVHPTIMGKNTPRIFSPKDETRRAKWLKSIQRKDFVPSSEAVECIKHFVSDYSVTVDQATRADGSILCIPRTAPKLTDDAVSTMFSLITCRNTCRLNRRRREKRQMKGKLN